MPKGTSFNGSSNCLAVTVIVSNAIVEEEASSFDCANVGTAVKQSEAVMSTQLGVILSFEILEECFF